MTDAFHSYSLDRKAIPVIQVNGLVRAMTSLGFPVEEQLEGTGIEPRQLRNDDARVTYRQRIAQVERMLVLVDDRSYWLLRRRDVAISDFGLLGYAMMSSATLAQAVQIAVKYHRMAGTMFDLRFLVEDDEAVIRIEHLITGGAVGEYIVEDLFLGIEPLISLLLGEEHKPLAIHLNYAQPDVDVSYNEVFGCTVAFEQPYCDYRFAAADLKLPLAAADSNTARVCEDSCRQLLDQMEIEDDIISRICHLLLSTPGEFPRLDVVAEKLSLGSRTLRRRLNSRGTSYQQVLDDVRKQLATEYLETTDLTVQEIAELLGYTEVTNFRRAFLKWSGLSPYQYRKQLGSELAS